MKVSDFFLRDEKAWDVNKVFRHFSSEDANAILNTRIPQGYTRDRIAWVHTDNGQYTVKSGYFEWCKIHTASEGIYLSNGWSKIWRLKIPHKVKVFLWRYCRNSLPVRNVLRGRGVPVPIACSLCVGDVEHMNHLFLDCKYAQECWQEVNLNFSAREEEFAHEWLINMLSRASNDSLTKIATVLWGIWYVRNKRIFESKVMTAASGNYWSKKQVDEWQLANDRPANVQDSGEYRNSPDHKWKPPGEDQLKVNVDASVIAGQDSFSVGMVVRNSHGQYVAGKTLRCAGIVSVLEAELVGIWEAILWTQEISEGPIIIESDSLLSVKAINHGHDYVLEIGDLVQQCQEKLRTFNRISVSHVKKQANKVAHNLARIPCERNCFIDHPSPPSCLLETLLSDALVF